ncbi:MAG: glycosyltransferase [Actinomycetota bacterium]|nr:glycosyltransferase [Actinomycetota bacterium]
MFAFGVCIGNDPKYERCARPGLERTVLPGDLVVELRHQFSIHAAYNKVLEAARDLSGLQAVVLLHEDLEIADDRFRDKVALAFEDPEVGVLGAVGAVNVTSLAWWEGSLRGALAESRLRVEGDRPKGEVETVDGSLLCLSPWVARNLRFDETYAGFHGYDADLCFSARAAGKKVLVEELKLFHHTKGGYGDLVSFARNDELFRRKWIPAERHRG